MKFYWIFASLFCGLLALALMFGYTSLLSRGSIAGVLSAVFAFGEVKEAHVLFVGDMMFDRTIRDDIARDGADHIFDGVNELLGGVDFVVGNLEGPITSRASLSRGTRPGDKNNTRFTFDPSVASMFAGYGFKLVTIGNNHITDFGKEGVVSTKKYLDAAGIASVGDPFATSTEPVVVDIEGIQVAFTAYNAFIRSNPAQTRAAIRRARELGADFIVVLTHWGNEYESAPPDSVRRLAAIFAVQGANLIIGTHSHVRGEVEDIGKTRVYYSLGNFIFDQYWDVSVRCGLAVSVTLVKTGTTTSAQYSETSTYLERGGSTTTSCP